MTMPNRGIFRSASIPLLLCIAMNAQAQEDLEEIVVTGSYIARPADRPQPVQILDAAQIANEQRNSVSEIFRDMTISNGTFTGMLNASENAGSTTSTVNLRGLGPRATLVLLNGRRQTNDGGVGPGGLTAVDINALAPGIMLERVEVLTDGASALYGSDAVAGVVNMITRNDFEGLELEVSGMQVDRAGTNDVTFGALFGSQGENTSIVAGLESTSRPEIVTQDIYDFQRLGIATTSSFGMPGSLQPLGAMGGARRFPDPLCADEALGGQPVGGVNRGNNCGLLLSLDRSIVSATDRVSGLTVITHDFEGGISAEVELGFSRARISRVNNTFPINDQPRPIVPANNPGVIAEHARSGLAIQDWQIWQRLRKPQDPNFNIRNQMSSDTWRAAAALLGDFNDDWSWNLTSTFSKNDFEQISGDTIRERYNNALRGFGGPGCDLGGGGASGYGADTIPGTADDATPDIDCLWYNPLGNQFIASPGDPNYNDVSILSYMFAEAVTKGFADLSTLDFVVTGSLGERAGLAVGYQIRDQGFRQDFNPLTNEGAFAFMNDRVPDYDGNRDANALFAELVLFPTEDLEIQLAARTEEYSGGASSTDPKIGVLWTPTDSLFIRATAGTSFRVAGEPQTFGVDAGMGAGVELCGLGCPPGPVENIDAGAVTRGDPGLAPEESQNFTVGFTWDIADGVTLDMNYWSIEFTNLIVQESSQVIWFNDIQDGTIDDPRIVLNPAAGTNVISQLIANDILAFNLSFVNEDSLETNGLDFGLNWNFDVGRNQFGLRLNGTQTMTYDITTPGGGTVDGVGSLNSTNNGFATPDFAANLRFNWSMDEHFAQATFRHIGALVQDNPLDVEFTDEEAFNTIDLLYRYAWDLRGGPMDISVGILNVTDAEDPQIDGNLTTVNTRVWEPRGRMYRVGVSKGF